MNEFMNVVNRLDAKLPVSKDPGKKAKIDESQLTDINNDLLRLQGLVSKVAKASQDEKKSVKKLIDHMNAMTLPQDSNVQQEVAESLMAWLGMHYTERKTVGQWKYGERVEKLDGDEKGAS